MTNEELNAIKERAEKATEGPWQLAHTTDDTYVLDDSGDIVGSFERQEDADFATDAREDIPKLLAEIERLQSGITRLRDRLMCDLDAVTSGDDDARSSAYDDCLTSTLRRIDRYILNGGDTDA